jgi:hypothetical protein
MCMLGYFALETGTLARQIMQSRTLGKPGLIKTTPFSTAAKKIEQELHIMKISMQKSHKLRAVGTLKLFAILTTFGPVQKSDQ